MSISTVPPAVQPRVDAIDLQVNYGHSMDLMLTTAMLDIVGHGIEDAEVSPNDRGVVTVKVWPMTLTRLTRQSEFESIAPAGWSHAGIEHQLAYARSNRNRQRETPILAYGGRRIMNGWTFVPCLDLFQGQRRIRYRSDATFSPGTVVLLVKNP